jgi:adenine deaminase
MTLTFQNVSLVDVLSGTVKPHRTVINENDLIASIGTIKNLRPMGKAIDLKDTYMIPGLIDAHVHVTNMHIPNEQMTEHSPVD